MDGKGLHLIVFHLIVYKPVQQYKKLIKFILKSIIREFSLWLLRNQIPIIIELVILISLIGFWNFNRLQSLKFFTGYAIYFDWKVDNYDRNRCLYKPLFVLWVTLTFFIRETSEFNNKNFISKKKISIKKPTTSFSYQLLNSLVRISSMNSKTKPC